MRPSTPAASWSRRSKLPAEWAGIEVKEASHGVDMKRPEFVRSIVDPINALKGDLLPVSTFNGREDGTWDNGTAAWEKRGIAVNVPRVADRELYPVQPVRLRLPARRDPSVPGHRRGGRRIGRSMEAGPGRDEGVQIPASRFRRSTVRVAAIAWTSAPPSRRRW